MVEKNEALDVEKETIKAREKKSNVQYHSKSQSTQYIQILSRYPHSLSDDKTTIKCVDPCNCLISSEYKFYICG